MTDVIGTDGPPVLLLPGGAESVDGFFPGLVDGLLEEPGCRVVLHDRPGTGRAAGHGNLADAPDSLHETLAELGLGPAVVVGQSLGGAVAELLACAHPGDVSGLVLLDPSPINDPALARQLERTMGVTHRLSRLPVAGRAVRPLLRLGSRSTVRKASRPDTREAVRRTLALDVAQLADTVSGFADLAADFRESDLPVVPAVVVTADRKRGASITAAHQRVADALRVPLVSWPGAEHAVHLTHPDEVLEATRAVVRQVRSRPGRTPMDGGPST
jgi:pimeloyl-ACP methyl ester carboxylesterase